MLSSSSISSAVKTGRSQNSTKSRPLFVTMTSQPAALTHWYCSMSSKDDACTAQVKQRISFFAIKTALNGIHHNICVKEYASYLKCFSMIANVRSSMSSAVNFNRAASSRCLSVSLFQASCRFHSGADLACLRNHLVLSDSATPYFRRTRSTTSGFASSIDSVRYVTTMRFCSCVMLRSSAAYGAIGVSLILCANVVIILTDLVSGDKDTNNIRIKH